MNSVVYFESNYLKQKYIQQWKIKGDILHYELNDAERLPPALASQFFQFAVFVFDVYSQEKQQLIAKLLPWKRETPFIILANHYENAAILEDLEFQKQQQVYYFKKTELKDIPGITLRILKQQSYYRRSLVREKTHQTAELLLEKVNLRVTLKDITKNGARLELRKDPKTFTQKNAILVHTLFDGSQVKVPVEICWANSISDGRLSIGTKFSNVAFKEPT